MATIHNLIKKRAKNYGRFDTEATLIQQLYNSILYHAAEVSGVALDPVHCEALHMICHKIGRITNGSPDHRDSWRDIAGYATMVSEHIRSKS